MQVMPHVLCMLAKLRGILFIDGDEANAYLANDSPKSRAEDENRDQDFSRRTPEFKSC
jgi:hypothetical protein